MRGDAGPARRGSFAWRAIWAPRDGPSRGSARRSDSAIGDRWPTDPDEAAEEAAMQARERALLIAHHQSVAS